MGRNVLIIAVAGFAAVAACSSPEGAAPEPADAPAALPPGRPAIYEAARAGPEEFVRAIYAAYAADAMGESPAAGQDPIYSRMMAARIGADARRPGGEPRLDYDPICDCQDPAGMGPAVVEVTGASTTEATGVVRFPQAGEEKTLTLKLLKEGPMWRVEDVLVEGRPPLSEVTMEGLE
ncbi:DUF3828 domain-containing protein [Brevundimonas sp.]|uniref:DUF3828 domain-containing protein n=1 Tax=Brevundimonas sp. TaxID=1871086 RepID=UPI002737F4A4|nr:DUF3828 domain-containing protein [Brevundimonas sp.]MDP3802269.1 DUF3828 domain-containing protein [Brevundimonas sp.]